MEQPVRPLPLVGRPITVLLVADGYGLQLESTLADEDDLVVRTASSIDGAPGRLADADCLVGEFALIAGDDGDLLERIAERNPALPVVLLVDGPDESAAAVDAMRSLPRADCTSRDLAATVPEQIGRRIRTLVEHRRLADLSRRSLAGVEFAGDAVAVAAPDGDLAFATRAFAMQFGTDRDDLPGTSWRDLFDDDSAARLERTAIPTVADGWRWTGVCTARRDAGETFDVRVRLGGLEDGSLVFVVDTPALEDDSSEGAEEKR